MKHSHVTWGAICKINGDFLEIDDRLDLLKKRIKTNKYQCPVRYARVRITEIEKRKTRKNKKERP